MVNTPKKNFSPLPGGKYGKPTKRSTQRHHQANAGKSGLEAETVRALGAFNSFGSNMKLAAAKRRDMHFLSSEEKQKWIEVYVERETAGARMRVEDAEAVVQQEHDDTRKAENAGLTNRESEIAFQGMMVAIRNWLSDLASSDDGEDGEDEDDEVAQQGQLSEDDKHGCVAGTITKTVQQRMERIRLKQMMLD